MILVTGGTGYIGSQVCRALGEKGIDYSILSRKNGPKCIKYDLLTGNQNELKEILLDYSKIIHCAWFVDRSAYLHSPKNFDWVNGTLKLANALEDQGIQHFLSLGTCLEYKPSARIKKVTDPTEATSNYSLAKILTHSGLTHILKTKNIPLAWCRIFHLYGGREDCQRLFPSVKAALMKSEHMEVTNSNLKIDLSHIFSVAQDIIKVSEGYSGNFNLSSGNGGTIEEHVRQHFPAPLIKKFISFTPSSTMMNNLYGNRNVPL